MALPADEVDPTPAPASSAVWPLVRLVALVPAVVLILLGSGAAVYQQQHADRIYRGISVLAQPLGGYTRAEAQEALRGYVRRVRERPLTIQFHELRLVTSLGSLGIQMRDEEIDRLVALAWMIGREVSLGQWVAWQRLLLTQGYEVPASFTLDLATARSGLEVLATQLDQAPASAAVQISPVGATFTVQLLPARPGRQLNLTGTLDRLQRSVAGHVPTTVELVVDETPPLVTDADLAGVRARVAELLQSALVLRAGETTWTVEPADLYLMLDGDALTATSASPVVQLKHGEVQAYVAALAEAANQPPRNASLAVRDDAVVIVPEQAGQRFDEVATVRLIMERALTVDRTIDLPVVADDPWLRGEDLVEVQQLAEYLLFLPMVVRYGEHEWLLERPALLSMVSMPALEAISLDDAGRPIQEQPGFAIGLDRDTVQRFIDSEVAPWVSRIAEEARVTIRDGKVEVIAGGIGLVPDQERTYEAMVRALRQTLPTERVAPVYVQRAGPEQTAAQMEQIRSAAVRLVSDPVELRYEETRWSITAAELAKMLRFQHTDAGLTPSLASEPLLAHIELIAADARQRQAGPRTPDGQFRPLDVTATAAAVWQAVLSEQRQAEVQFVYDSAGPLIPTATPPPGQSPPWVPTE